MIIAHKLPNQLKLLVELLDDSRNDIFLLFDKNAETLFDKDELRRRVNHSSLFFVSSIKITWIAASQVFAEVFLLKKATAIGYQYYHLLSGVDLPLHYQNYIHSFSSRHFGENYIEYKCRLDQCHRERLDKYHFFQEYLGRRPHKYREQIKRLNMKSLQIQDLLGVHRLGNDPSFFYNGANWFSITHCLAKFLLSKGRFISHYFKYSYCGDEELIQTLTAHSPLNATVSETEIRFIDWRRGSPYTWRNKDFDELISSDKLFARKFDIMKYSDIVMRIYNSVKQENS